MSKAVRTIGPVCAMAALIAVVCGEIYAWPVDGHPLPLLGFPVGLFGTLIVSCVGSALAGTYFVPREERFDIYDTEDDGSTDDENLPSPTARQIVMSCGVGVVGGVLGALYHQLFQDGSHAGFVATILISSMASGCLGLLFAPPVPAAVEATPEVPEAAPPAAREAVEPGPQDAAG